MEKLTFIKNHKYISLIVFNLLVLCLFICIFLPNNCWRLESQEHIEKVKIIEPNGQEQFIVTEEVINTLDTQFHRHVLFSLGSLNDGRTGNYSIVLYDGENNPLRGFSYDLEDKKIYPGKVILPKKTVQAMEEIINAEIQI